MYAAYIPFQKSVQHRSLTDKTFLRKKNGTAYGDRHPVYAHRNYAAYGKSLHINGMKPFYLVFIK